MLHMWELKVQSMVKSAAQKWARCQLSAAASYPMGNGNLLTFTVAIIEGLMRVPCVSRSIMKFV